MTQSKMKWIRGILLARQWGLVKYSFVAWIVAFVPSLTFAGAAYFILQPKSLPYDESGSGLSASTNLILSVLVAPLVETFLLSGLLVTLRRWVGSWVAAVIISAFLFSLLHGSVGLIWFFGTIWSFLVFAFSFSVWCEGAYWKGYFAAVLPHMLVNLAAAVVGFLFGGVQSSHI